MKKVLVCGGRDYRNWNKFEEVLSGLKDIELIINGCASGADSFSQKWAFLNQTPFLNVPAKWNTHGKSAGPIRNRFMLNAFGIVPDLVVAFPGGKGTANMVAQAKEAGIEVIEIKQ